MQLPVYLHKMSDVKSGLGVDLQMIGKEALNMTHGITVFS